MNRKKKRMETPVHFQNIDLADVVMVRNLPNTDDKMAKEPFERVVQNDIRTIMLRVGGSFLRRQLS